MRTCGECPGVQLGAVARTMTTVIVALASVVVLALGGCATPRGIESAATLAAPATLGADATAAVPAEAAYDLATQRYRAGIGGYLTVLNAENNGIAQRRLTTELRARAIDSQMLLVRALGGGYVAPAEASQLARAGAVR